jgi:IS30 family transposase
MIKHITDKGKYYTHFSREEREEIAIGLERGASIRSIAK